MKTTAFILLSVATGTYAACPNMCSGHGACGNDDICHCYQDWLNGDEEGGDCSKKKCPYEIAWVDTPSEANKGHALAECANRGVCDRETGDCICFEGYTGKGCRRTTCPNDCSGHGTCEYISELRNDLGDNFKVSGDAPTTDQYDHEFPLLWDAHKSRACVCDPKWTDVDCSRRMCPKGNYKLYYDNTDAQEVQTVTVTGDCTNEASQDKMNEHFITGDQRWGLDVQFALTFRTTLNEEFTTKTLSMASTAKEVEDAINSLPNKVIEDVVVTLTHPTTAWTNFPTDTGSETQDNVYSITFYGAMNTGDQHAFECRTQSCTKGCVPQISRVMQDTTGASCAVTDDDHLYASQDADWATTRTSYTPTSGHSAIRLKTVNTECSTRGHCSYDTGMCECFEGYTDEYCSTQTALI